MTNKTIALFIPCYVDQLYPEVAVATLKILQKLGLNVQYPMDQTCCGQPLYNSGCFSECKPLAKKFIKTFQEYDYIVAPSGSCISMVKHNYKKLDDDAYKVFDKSYELIEFLYDIVGLEKVKNVVNQEFQAIVGIHNSCHAHRELNLASKSEHNEQPFSKIIDLLSLNKHIQIKLPKRVDECCGFGGTFSLNEPEVSTAMGNDRISEHMDNKVEFITAVDISCLMHMQGLINRQKKPLKTIHISQLLLGEIS